MSAKRKAVRRRLYKRSRRIQINEPKNLESLPRDLVVQVIRKVNHEDLKQILLVSKNLKNATLTARKLYFMDRTPKTKVPATVKTPDAPKQDRLASWCLKLGKCFSGGVRIINFDNV